MTTNIRPKTKIIRNKNRRKGQLIFEGKNTAKIKSIFEDSPSVFSSVDITKRLDLNKIEKRRRQRSKGYNHKSPNPFRSTDINNHSLPRLISLDKEKDEKLINSISTLNKRKFYERERPPTPCLSKEDIINIKNGKEKLNKIEEILANYIAPRLKTQQYLNPLSTKILKAILDLSAVEKQENPIEKELERLNMKKSSNV